MKYLRLSPDEALPNIADLVPFQSVVVVEEDINPEWQCKVSNWLVESGCLYMMVWGKECSFWDDSIDAANMEVFHGKDIPEDKFVITTWHENEALEEVFWFSKNTAVHPTVEIRNTLLLHVSSSSKEKEYTNKYSNA